MSSDINGLKYFMNLCNINISTTQMHENYSFQAFVHAQLFTGCIVQEVATDADFAIQLKHISKSIKDKPSK